MEKKIVNAHSTNPTILLEYLIIFDVWLLIKTRWFLRHILQFLIPVFKVCLYMTLGAALLLGYALHAKIDIEHNAGIFSKNGDSAIKYLEIDDNSKPGLITLNSKKELIRIKGQMKHLERMLNRMNIHLNHLRSHEKGKSFNLADFASETVGGIVVDTPDTQSFHKPVSNQMTLFGIPIWKANNYTPRKVIQPWTEPGECWAFVGSYGKVEIQLAYTVIIESITLEHIPISASLTGNIDSAPKIFNVLGKIKDSHVLIDTFMYKINGPPSQTFKIKKMREKIPFKRVILEVLSNWGNPHYTCIYRFKVHGKLYDTPNNEHNMNIQ